MIVVDKVHGIRLVNAALDASSCRSSGPQSVAQSSLSDTNEVAGWVAKRTVAYAPRLGRRLLQHLGAGPPDFLEGGVKVVGAEDCGLQRPLGHERQEGIALGLRTTAVGVRQDDVDVLSWGADGNPPEAFRRNVLADLKAERVSVEAKRYIGVVYGDEHCREADCHARTVEAPTGGALLRSCSTQRKPSRGRAGHLMF